MKGLNTILLPIVLLFTVVVGRTETACAQSSLNDSCICYTDDMDKKCLECLVNKPRKDSLIYNYSLQIINFKTVVANNKTIIADLENKSLEDNKKIQKQSLALKRTRRMVKIGFFGGLAGGLIGGLLLSN